MAQQQTLAAAYLARGADDNHMERFKAFVASYRAHNAGIEHKLFVIFKGFADDDHLRTGASVFQGLDFSPIYTDDLTFDIGAYLDAAKQMSADQICFLNTNSELSAHHWLAKLSNAYCGAHVGLVGATGSFESLNLLDSRIPRFPNVHLRSNAFIIGRQDLIDIFGSYTIRSKLDAFFAESGVDSLTRRIFQSGRTALIVGNDGRGYKPENWPMSFTFRQADQRNLLVKDNVTRTFDRLPWKEKKQLSVKTWGSYIDGGLAKLIPDANS